MISAPSPRSFLGRWQALVLGLLCLAILAHFVLFFGSEATPLTFALFPSFSIQSPDLPLLLALILCGTPLVLQIFLKIFKGNLGADLLAAIAVGTALILEQYLAGNLILLMLASGQLLESFAVRRASSALSALAERMPSIAHRREDGAEGDSFTDIPLEAIQMGDVIALFPHETCPVDGLVLEGHGSMDESYLTGEPYDVTKVPGAAVLSGAINGSSLLTLRATALAQDSRYAKIMEVMAESEQKRPHIRRLSDQLGAIFAPFALLYGAAAWILSDEPLRFLAVLVIATPCPLLIAIPITIIGAISLAAQRGIIIKNPAILEQLPLCKTAIFDKTGTLTYGRAALEKIITFHSFDKNQVLQQVASLERASTHPLSRAILRAAEGAGLPFLKVESISEKPGEGLSGHLGGHSIHITNRKTLQRLDPAQADLLPPDAPGMESVIRVDGVLAGLMIFRDQVRSEGPSFIRHLGPVHHFEKIMLLSGDRLSEVQYVGEKLGIHTILASQSPEQKVEIVRSETRKAPTLFMGDGINDAPALAAATVGLAFGAQNIVTTETAGAVFLENSLERVDEILHISLLMRRTALASAGGGMALSLVGMIFAGMGLIPPVWGALLQEGVDILAIIYALQLTWHGKVKGDIQGEYVKETAV